MDNSGLALRARSRASRACSCITLAPLIRLFCRLINKCFLSVGHVHNKMEILENIQQGTESRTALVEDRVNVVEDSVHHLQGDLSIFFNC